MTAATVRKPGLRRDAGTARSRPRRGPRSPGRRTPRGPRGSHGWAQRGGDDGDHDGADGAVEGQRQEAGLLRDLGEGGEEHAEARARRAPRRRSPAADAGGAPARAPARGRPARSPAAPRRCPSQASGARALAGGETDDERDQRPPPRPRRARPRPSARRRGRGRGTPCRRRCRPRPAPPSRGRRPGGHHRRSARATRATAAPPSLGEERDRPRADAARDDTADEVGQPVGQRGAEGEQDGHGGQRLAHRSGRTHDGPGPRSGAVVVSGGWVSRRWACWVSRRACGSRRPRWPRSA